MRHRTLCVLAAGLLARAGCGGIAYETTPALGSVPATGSKGFQFFALDDQSDYRMVIFQCGGKQHVYLHHRNAGRSATSLVKVGEYPLEEKLP